MCYLLMAIGQPGRYPFILAANRDEYYTRQTAPAGFWEDAPHILGGRDLEQRGTWMGASKNGRFAALTNFRQPGNHDPSARSRGLLIPDFLSPTMEIESFSQRLEESSGDYNGFSLVFGRLPDRLYYFSNRSGKPPCMLDHGVYALSNHLLDTPWPKVETGKAAFRQIIARDEDPLDSLFELLGDTRKAAMEDLPDTGIDPDLEHLLSSIFIEGGHYGTRSSTVVGVNRRGQLRFSELMYTQDHQAHLPTREFTLDLSIGSSL